MWIKSEVSQLPLSGVRDGDDTFEGRRDAFNKPLKEDILQYLGHKNLSPETMKKVKWVDKTKCIRTGAISDKAVKLWKI